MRVLRFLLSHHFADELNRCFVVGPVHLCARCAGLYPVLALTLALNVLAKLPQELFVDPVWIFLLPAPAFFDWRLGRFDPSHGSNRRRLVTGLLAGIGFGRALYVLSRFPDDPRPWALFGVIGVLALLVERRARQYRAEVG